jgi:maltooligosyltrehalose trehalohydrolase
MNLKNSLGARVIAPGRCEFRVWAPNRDRVELRIDDRTLPMEKIPGGYHVATVDAREGDRYYYVLDGIERPDPASRFQPEGVHEASEVIDSNFEWHDVQWNGVALEDFVIYELHVGTFTPEGTLDAVIPKLDALKELGITAIELLPVGQFPGDRNWGYDGVYINAVQNSYGGPRALKRLIDAAHQRGLAIVLDVVYNHLGPEGNYLAEFGPYFTDRYKTAWGSALNFDGPYSDDVRWFFIHNALMWINEFHVDALRVDAVHAIIDQSAEPFLRDLTTAVRETGRRVYTIAESNLNDPRVIAPMESHGLGFDSQWSDDLHHALHTLLTGEKSGYYVGYGAASDLALAIATGYLYTGQHSVYRGRKYGAKPKTTNGAQFVVSTQNHDQVGNRMHGERLSALVSREKLRLAAAVLILSPFLPMLFMGEEYGETAPFQYFTSHSDPDLIDSVRRGRREEFKRFDWEGEAPDPHAEETFQRSKLTWKEDDSIRKLYRDLLRLRRESFRDLDLSKVVARSNDERRIVTVRRGDVLLAFNFSDKPQTEEGVTIPAWDFVWSALPIA